MKKNKENKPRHLTLNRETIHNLEDPQLLEQVRGGTSQWGCTTRTGAMLNEASSGC